MKEENKNEQRVVDEEGSVLQWHPAFYAGIQIELESESDKLIFESEHNLSKKPMQLLITSELSKEENLWLKCLTNDLDDVSIIDELSREYGAHEQEGLYKAVMDVIVRANKEKFKEVTNMCEALKEIWAEDFEQARNEGIEIGYVKGMIETGKNLGVSREKVFELVQEKFSMTSEDAEENMKLYW